MAVAFALLLDFFFSLFGVFGWFVCWLVGCSLVAYGLFVCLVCCLLFCSCVCLRVRSLFVVGCLLGRFACQLCLLAYLLVVHLHVSVYGHVAWLVATRQKPLRAPFCVCF